MKRLEAIVEAMESGDLPLETLMEKFEEGTKLAKLCQGRLADAQLRIEQIERTAAGTLKMKPFEAEDGNE